jgi:hypothetical protein
VIILFSCGGRVELFQRQVLFREFLEADGCNKNKLAEDMRFNTQ